MPKAAKKRRGDGSLEDTRLFDRYVEACNYPSELDEHKVETALHAYLSALRWIARSCVSAADGNCRTILRLR